jgi:hypothetical protein
MSLNFEKIDCKTYSSKKIFGICDNPIEAAYPAYIDEQNGAQWLAVVENGEQKDVTFTAIDNCINIVNNGNKIKACDGMLTYESHIIFVELKDRKPIGNAWVEDGIPQLKSSITEFEKTETAVLFKKKLAYICNRQHPKFKSTQKLRMDAFFEETKYVLRIQGRIKLIDLM